MITADTLVFPENAVSLIVTRLQMIDADLYACRRPLRQSDPVQAIGVFGVQWLPTEDSYEMRGAPLGRHEPTLSQYLVAVQSFVKDGDEERGLAVHSVLAKTIRAILYRDDPLRVALLALSVSLSGSVESAKRFGIRTQRYLSNEVQGSWLYLSTLELWLETETV